MTHYYLFWCNYITTPTVSMNLDCFNHGIIYGVCLIATNSGGENKDSDCVQYYRVDKVSYCISLEDCQYFVHFMFYDYSCCS